MEEINHKRLFRCACANMRAVSRALTQHYDAALASTGLKTSQYSVLVSISRYQPLSITHLANKLLMDQTTLTRNLKPLEKEGLVIRTTATDQRIRLLELTAAGKAKLTEMIPLWEITQQSVEKEFGNERYSNLLKELSALMNTVAHRQ